MKSYCQYYILICLNLINKLFKIFIFRHEIKTSDKVSEDNNQLKLKYTNIKELNDKLQGDIQNHKSVERKNDHLLSEARKQIYDLQEKIKQYDKQKVVIKISKQKLLLRM